TESSKIPQTIMSRVTKLDFKMGKPTDIIEALRKIAEKEKIKIDEESLQILSKKSDGSFRDGVKLLEQFASSGLEGISTGDFDGLMDLIRDISKKDSKLALINLNKMLESGLQVKQLILDLMENLRFLFLIKNDLGSLVKEDLGSGRFEKLLELAENFKNIKDITFALDKLQEALEKLKFASILSLPLEIALVEVCEEQNQKQTIEDSKVEDSNLKIENRSLKENALSSNLNPQKSIIHHLLATVQTGDQSDLVKLREKWTFVLETIRPFNFSLEALLRNAKVKSADSGEIILEVPYSFHQRILEAPKSKDLLESVLAEVLGKVVKVSTVLGTRPQRVEDIANIEIAPEDEIISLASDIFNGKLVD
ncbi:MAG: DNA polymerase III subunit gamma/tau, partial [Microgenomates group bacterium Gr01-1014_93]